MLLFFLIIGLYFLIPHTIAQIFNPIEELVILIRIPDKEKKSKTQMHLAIAETKIEKCSIKFRFVQTFLCFS